VHRPPWQTIPVPQEVPFGRLPFSVQTGAPVVQTFEAVRHGLVGVQALPATQARHEPAPHTMFRPQTVPFACVI
jgi:hypothetical protein